jgi:hypothetical protein
MAVSGAIAKAEPLDAGAPSVVNSVRTDAEVLKDVTPEAEAWYGQQPLQGC